MKRFIGSCLIGLAASVAAPALAQDTPTSAPGVKVISVDEGKKLLDQKAAAFFDTRSALNFGKGHVPGAKGVSYREKSDKKADFDASVDGFDLAKLPADKNAAIVIYSDGPAGWKSYKASVLAAKGGYKNVNYMRGGWTDWQAKGFPAGN